MNFPFLSPTNFLLPSRHLNWLFVRHLTHLLKRHDKKQRASLCKRVMKCLHVGLFVHVFFTVSDGWCTCNYPCVYILFIQMLNKLFSCDLLSYRRLIVSCVYMRFSTCHLQRWRKTGVIIFLKTYQNQAFFPLFALRIFLQNNIHFFIVNR